MIHCPNCIHWQDQSLRQIESEHGARPATFMGCRIFGFAEGNATRESCPHYTPSKDLYTLCDTCGRTVPKVCVSLGECINCIDTDLFCTEHCIGGDSRKYCTHFVRLHTEGHHLIEKDQVFDLFPALGMPEKTKQEK